MAISRGELRRRSFGSHSGGLYTTPKSGLTQNGHRTGSETRFMGLRLRLCEEPVGSFGSSLVG